MNSNFYFEKLKNSVEFKEFLNKNSNAFLCSAFFIRDKKGKENKQHFDFWIPEKEKIFSFELENNLRVSEIEKIENSIPLKFSFDFNFDFEVFENLILKEMKKKKIGNEIEKFLFSFQKFEEKNILVGTIFLSKLGLLQFSFDLDKKIFISFEKRSFFDLIKINSSKK
jgi:hypothetical protein